MGKLLKAATAFVGLVALISPVSAQAQLSNWKDKGVAITQSYVIPLQGSMSYSGGISCTSLSATLSLQPGSTGSISSYSVEPATCTITGTLKALGCTSLSTLTSENLPWVTHDTTTQVTVTGTKTTFHFNGGAFCPKTTTFSGNGMTLTPDNSSAFGSLAMAGELETSLGTNITAGGTLAPSYESDKGTFGL